MNKEQFKVELITLINKYNLENESSTPDHILADYLVDCLCIFNACTNNRTDWYRPDK